MKSKKFPQPLPMSSPISDSIQMLVEPSRILHHSLSLEQETRACGIIISQHAERHISLEDFDQRIMLMGDLAGEKMEAAKPNERQLALGTGTGSPIIMGTHGEFWRKHETTQATV
jgi:hypothetical protein